MSPGETTGRGNARSRRELPTFRYHPDPAANGAFEQMDGRCLVCGENPGWLYVLGAYGPRNLRDEVCPWCIADGSAASTHEVRFTEIVDAPDAIPEAVIRELEERTPGFSGWQQERWLFHCDDAAAFVGPAGWEELEDHPDALGALRVQIAGWGMDADETEMLVGSLDVDGSATAYLFRCLHCGTHLAYADLE